MAESDSDETVDYWHCGLDVDHDSTEDEYIQKKRKEKEDERGRKRVRHPELWKRNVAKRRRSQVSVTGQGSSGNVTRLVGTIDLGTVIILTLLILATNPTEPYSTSLTDTVGQASKVCTDIGY